MSNEEPKKHEKLGLITAIIGSLAIILVAVISAHSTFTRVWFYSLVIPFSVAILCLLIYQFIYPPVLRIIRNIKYRRKQNILVLKYSKKFRELVKDFYDCARSDRSHSLKNLMESIIQLQQEELNDLKSFYRQKKVALNDSISFVDIASTSMRMSHNLLDGNKNISLINNPLNRFIEYDHKNFRNQKACFILEVDYFQYILSVYESMIKNFIDVCRTTKQPYLLEKIKKEYMNFASDLDHFFKKYSDFGEKANEKFGETMFRTYFELPKMI